MLAFELHPRSRQARQLSAQHLTRGRQDVGAVLPDEVGQAHRGPLLPRHGTERRQIRTHREIPVATLPRGHRIALDGVHLDVDGEQVVAPLGAVLDDLLEEMAGGEALSLQAPLHVGERQHDRVDLARVDSFP